MNTSLHTTQKTTFLYHVITVCIFCCCTFGGFLTAQDDMGFEIIPELKSDEMATGQTSIQKIGAVGGEVMDTYRKEAEKLSLKEQMATGIMNWDTILNYLVYVVKFLSQIGLLIGALMIIYAGYLYASSVFGGKTNTGNSAIKNAIIGVLVISFSYAIMKFFTAVFLGS